MRELRICMEINGLAEDEKGNSCPGGMSLSLGMVPDENFEDKYKQLVAGLDVNEVLKLICLDEIFSESDCRIITPEEHDLLYGRDGK